MPTTDINVTLEEKPGNRNCVNVSNDDIEVDYNTTETITWTIDQSVYVGATLVSITFTGNPPWGDQIPSSPTNTISITDVDDDAHAGKTFNYVVTVNWDNKTWASDPKIVNKPKTSGTMEGTA